LKKKIKFIQVSCDGGAATGKSTGAKMLAKKYNLKFLSSGMLYRYASYLIIKYKPKNKLKFLSNNFKSLNYNHLKKIDLHTQQISQQSSIIAKNNEIRKILKKFQINFAIKYKNCCIEGRDISTKILPKSDIKFYFVCNLTIAAKRRCHELKKQDPKIKLQNVKKALRIRNYLDTYRKHSPLLKHRNSVEIDTGKLNKQAMLRKMSKYVEKVLIKKYGN
tara:strand:+ start:804 stop:1460 length:657 start_codon:yes stop_codon:yes gene_type:complete